MAVFNHDAAAGFYNEFGARQDRQGWYEKPAFDVLLTHGRLEEARIVCEFGVGTGALMARMFGERLGLPARGLGLDISGVMLGLAKDRLAPWDARIALVQTSGQPDIPVKDDSMDRVISTYVLDLLSERDISCFLDEARRVLRDDGLLCLAGITRGPGRISGTVSWVWDKVQRIRPALVGGCRPLELADRLTGTGWRIIFRQVVSPYGVASEIIIARP